ncbi:MAG: hypothetical protein KC501_12025, partial [Myxococcales bacterium]|nr:hypothetical protein [Myxococcales bacterium]
MSRDIPTPSARRSETSRDICHPDALTLDRVDGTVERLELVASRDGGGPSARLSLRGDLLDTQPIPELLVTPGSTWNRVVLSASTIDAELDPIILQEGEACSDTQGVVPTGCLGECAEGLTCDSRQTQTCIPYEPPPLVPLGGACTKPYECEQGYCRPPEGMTDVSEESPGLCTLPTPAGDPCSLPYECERYCTDG